mgnify:CR=1 FL=1
MQNQGHYLISLGLFCGWLAQQAEQLGVDIFTGFAATQLLYHEEGRVKGIATGDMGLDKNHQATPHFQPGVELHAQQTLLAEGCHGSLTKQACQQFKLRQNSQPQIYGLGIKELWQINEAAHQEGKVVHTIGWPLNSTAYGGSFLYHLPNRQLAVGLIASLDYKNPYFSPFDELQRFKHHPAIKAIFQGGKRLNYGARTISEGGLQALPKLTVPGGMLIGDSAGFVNVARIKGIHTAMKSAMTAAESIHQDQEIGAYPKQLQHTWLWSELYGQRNIRPAFKYGLWPGLIYSAIDSYLLRGRAPWTFKLKADHQSLQKKQNSKKIAYPKPDNEISFDKLSSVYLSRTYHKENQPCHLQWKNQQQAITVNYNQYGSPEVYYCPAAVYELVEQENGHKKLQINSANCLHCKACDIKDPSQNINWTPPEGGDGPNYGNL